MKTIKEFEENARKYNKEGMYRTFTQIAFDPEYYDVLTTFDTELEIDLFTFNEDTMKALVSYLDSINTNFLKPDYIPNISSDLERLGNLQDSQVKKIYEEAKKMNGTCEEKYMFDADINKFRTQIKVGGKNIKTLFDFIENTKHYLLKISKEYEDAIETCPYQLDQIVNGSIVYMFGEEKKYNLEFNFMTNNKRDVYVTACMLNQTVKNQEEFNELRFNS